MLKTIISQFSIPGTFVRAERFGSGLINDTYLCEFDDGGKRRKYILQRINASVFKHPEQVMENVEIVTSHIVKRLREGVDDPYAVTPALDQHPGRPIVPSSTIPARTGACSTSSKPAIGLRYGPGREHAYQVGRGLGRFQALVADLSPERLHDTLPGFHHTPRYLAAFDDALRADVKAARRRGRAEHEFVFPEGALAPALTGLIASKELPLRVVHNDPKVNNIMVHTVTGEALCMLDLDTVKPGIVHFDFGDCVRSAANPAGENAKDLESSRHRPGAL